MIVTEKNNGEKIQLPNDGVLILKLNAQPGTGYGWRVAAGAQGCLRPLGKPEVESPTSGIPGGTERQVFRFKAESPGTSVLEMHYVREWEKNVAPAKTFRLEVHVQ